MWENGEGRSAGARRGHLMADPPNAHTNIAELRARGRGGVAGGVISSGARDKGGGERAEAC